MKSKIIIIGAGFAGLKLARKLTNSSYEILIIDKNNHHQFQPLFYQVAAAHLEPSAVSFPLRKVFQNNHNVRIRVAEVQKIDAESQIIITSIGNFQYDVLVIATGATTNFFENSEIEQHAFPMKSTVEAVKLRQHILENFEEATYASQERKESLFNIVIAGGGATGVELAGALAEMKKNILPKDYPDFDYRLVNIFLVEGGNATLGPMSKISQEKSQTYLEQMGVKIKLNTRVKAYDGDKVELNNGEIICSNTLIWSAGIKGNVIDGLENIKIERGNRIAVDRKFKVLGFENIYALGDIAFMATDKYPNGHPQVASVAISQAEYFYRYLTCSYSSKNNFPDYEYTDKGSMATIGKNKAVVDFPKFSFQGFFAWILWMGIHVLLLMGMKNRLQVFINWVYAYFTDDSSLRLIFKNLYKKPKPNN
ncbi:MAG: NAD(P)/FAD-dependent oxidoreductase [Cytophagales bacterium]|nr:MAG: NAD(P)/FAD-dependent oxidoreductase [Cytophagales bacterium]